MFPVLAPLLPSPAGWGADATTEFARNISGLYSKGAHTSDHPSPTRPDIHDDPCAASTTFFLPISCGTIRVRAIPAGRLFRQSRRHSSPQKNGDDRLLSSSSSSAPTGKKIDAEVPEGPRPAFARLPLHPRRSGKGTPFKKNSGGSAENGGLLSNTGRNSLTVPEVLASRFASPGRFLGT